jgi:hypothetical protein
MRHWKHTVKLFVCSQRSRRLYEASLFVLYLSTLDYILDVTLHPITSKREGGMVTPTIFFPSQPQSRRNSNTSKLWTAIQLRVLSSGEKRHRCNGYLLKRGGKLL